MGCTNSEIQIPIPITEQKTKIVPQWILERKMDEYVKLQYYDWSSEKWKNYGKEEDNGCLLQIKAKTDDNLGCIPLPRIIYDDVVYKNEQRAPEIGFFSNTRAFPNTNRLRVPSQQKINAWQVPRKKGTQCDVWIHITTYEHIWVQGVIIYVSKIKNHFVVQTSNHGSFEFPMYTMDIAPFETFTKKLPTIAELPIPSAPVKKDPLVIDAPPPYSPAN